jgi:hypothetical protein
MSLDDLILGPLDSSPAAAVLEEAADVLLVHGWCKTQGHDNEGRFCVLGAVAEAVEPGWYEVDRTYYWSVIGGMRVVRDALAALANRLPEPSPPEDAIAVYQWNDATIEADDIRDTLLLAAKDLRNGQQS